jgi:hypothetical protein
MKWKMTFHASILLWAFKPCPSGVTGSHVDNFVERGHSPKMNFILEVIYWMLCCKLISRILIHKAKVQKHDTIYTI